MQGVDLASHTRPAPLNAPTSTLPCWGSLGLGTHAHSCCCHQRSHFAPATLQSMDRLIRSTAMEHFHKLGQLLSQLPPRCLVFAAYCSRSLSRE